MILSHFDDNPGFVPFGWMRAHLVLDSDIVSYSQWREVNRVFRKALGGFHVTMSKSIFSGLKGVSPGGVRHVLSGMYGDKVSDRAAKDDHRWGEACVSIRCIAILKHGSLEGISVQGAVMVSVVDQ